MVHLLGDFLVIQSVLETLDQAGCGYTIDSFKFGPRGERAVQWVVARPLALDEPQSWPPLQGVLEELPREHNLELGLSNSSLNCLHALSSLHCAVAHTTSPVASE